LQKLLEKIEDEETFMEKANKTVMFQPNFMGMGVNFNELLAKYFKRSQKK